MEKQQQQQQQLINYIILIRGSFFSSGTLNEYICLLF